MDYKTSGVDIDAGNEVVRRVRQLARSTFTQGVLSEIGAFGGLFRLDVTRYREPILVSSAGWGWHEAPGGLSGPASTTRSVSIS